MLGEIKSLQTYTNYVWETCWKMSKASERIIQNLSDTLIFWNNALFHNCLQLKINSLATQFKIENISYKAQRLHLQ